MAEALQPLLEQAVRESLRELARCAAEPETCVGGSQSIESIVRTVATKVLDEASDKLESLGVGVEKAAKLEMEKRAATKKPPPEPLLEDIRATPWVVWREGSPSRGAPSRGRVHSDDLDMRDEQAEQPPYTMVFQVEEVAPEESSPWARQISEESQVCDLEPQRFMPPGAEEEDTVPLPPARMGRSLSACMGSENLGPFQPPARHSLQSSMGVASMVSPAHHTRSRALSPGSTSIGERPLIVKEGLTIPSNVAQHTMMQWKGRPRAVLLVAKPGDRLVLATVHDMAAWLASQGMVVVMEPQLLADQPSLRSSLKTVRTFTRGDKLERSIDLVITVGGDGTLTWAVSLFGSAMPPVLSFAAGSLGFLTPFPLDGWVRTLTRLLDLHRPRRPMPLVCRMRLQVVVHRRKGSLDGDGFEDEGVQVQCLNEVLVHRGQSGALAKLDVGVDGERVTLVQGDGLILATPTGSTAYSLAAGGSMAHPSVPAILLTPVSPHSLSFRPALLPDSAVITVAVPLTARYGAALSVDGKDVCALRLGDSVEVAMSPHPVPTICCTSETGDWFGSVHEALQWNGRLEQK
mmetsp:Transcript_101379/g.295342  ORF Transcript_101379/g.295342 Transcript_101379/m.295342 type:complete len:576 (+) Transcript_101379:122-1849(+)